MKHACMARDYTQDLEAILIAKPAKLTLESLSMYQDHVVRPLVKATAGLDGQADSAEVDDAQDCVGFLLSSSFYSL